MLPRISKRSSEKMLKVAMCINFIRSIIMYSTILNKYPRTKVFINLDYNYHSSSSSDLFQVRSKHDDVPRSVL